MPTFEIRREMLDATMNGMFGGTADPHQVKVPGLPRYFVDGQEVSGEEYRAAVAQWEARVFGRTATPGKG